ncbi:MAG: flavodoxin family protein [Candidatus Hydrothermarchaeota archaeon]
MKIKVLALVGSPRKGGNTDRLLDRAIEGAKSEGAKVEKIYVAFKNIEPCGEIFDCIETGECPIKDDMNEIYEKIKEADSIFLATPVMTLGIPAKMKALMDRCQVFWAKKYVLKDSFISPEKKRRRKGLFISVAGMDYDKVFMGATMTVTAFFDIIDMEFTDTLLYNNMDKLGKIENHPTAMKDAYEKGKEIIRLIKKS